MSLAEYTETIDCPKSSRSQYYFPICWFACRLPSRDSRDLDARINKVESASSIGEGEIKKKVKKYSANPFINNHMFGECKASWN